MIVTCMNCGSTAEEPGTGDCPTCPGCGRVIVSWKMRLSHQASRPSVRQDERQMELL